MAYYLKSDVLQTSIRKKCFHYQSFLENDPNETDVNEMTRRYQEQEQVKNEEAGSKK